MRSTLIRIPYEIGGVPLFGFGLLLAVWAVVIVIVLGQQVRRHGWTRETFSHAGALALVAGLIVLLPRFFPEGMPIRGYGLLVLLGVVSGIGISAWRARQVGVNPDIVISLCMWMLVAGIVGARLFYVVQYWNVDVRQATLGQTALEIFNFPAGGLVIYGALLAGAAAFFYYNWRHRLPALAMGDLVAPGVALGIAFGRIGCFLNGCCYGEVTSVPWAVTFPRESTSGGYTPPYAHQLQVGQIQMHGLRLAVEPDGPPIVEDVASGSAADQAGLKPGEQIRVLNNVAIRSNAEASELIEEAFRHDRPLKLETTEGRTMEIPAVTPPPRSLPVHPTQLYSAVNAGLLALLLWAYFPFRRRDGEVAALLMMLKPAGRFLLEALRADEPAVWGTGLTISQNLSIAIFIVGAALFAYLRAQPPHRAFK